MQDERRDTTEAKEKQQKLSLSRETVRSLDDEVLDEVAGGCSGGCLTNNCTGNNCHAH